MFCEVERSYIEDGFNLYGLRACVSNFSDCLDLILDRIGPDDSDDSHLTQSACTLYGLIHARYIITAHGLDAMYNKYAAKEFGTCPLAQCSGQPVLPVGVRDEMGADTVKIFCPKCQCVYHPPPIRSRSSSHHGAGAAGVDGAAFGTTFPHLFLMTFSNLVPDPLPPNSQYVPRVFGFRVHMSARQRMNSNAAGAGGGDAAAGKSAKASSRGLSYSRSKSSQSGRGDSSKRASKASSSAAAAAAAAAAVPANAASAVDPNNVNASGAVAGGVEENKTKSAGDAAAIGTQAGNKRTLAATDGGAAGSSAKKPDANGNGVVDAKRRKA